MRTSSLHRRGLIGDPEMAMHWPVDLRMEFKKLSTEFSMQSWSFGIPWYLNMLRFFTIQGAFAIILEVVF